MVKSYKDLHVWQKGRSLVSDVYRLTESFPKTEQFILTQQVRRAVISIPSNVAEGSSKRSTKEFMRFLNIAYGSLCEVETQLFLACDLHYISEEQTNGLLQTTAELGRMINGLIRSLQQKSTELQTPTTGLPEHA